MEKKRQANVANLIDVAKRNIVINQEVADLYCHKAEELVAFIEKMVVERVAENKPAS